MIKAKYIAVKNKIHCCFSEMGLVKIRKPYHQAPEVHFSYSN